MAEVWNRKQRRKMARYGIGQEAFNKGIDEAYKRGEENASRSAFAGMILALYQEFNFPPDKIHDLAVETMKRINGAYCATELVERVRELTGFDVDQPLDEFEADITLMED